MPDLTHPRAAAALAALALGCAPALAGAGTSASGGRPGLELQRAGHSVRAALGSYCTSPPSGVSLCADAAYPLAIQRRLRVRPGGRLTLRTSVRARRLSAHLVRLDGDRVRQIGGRLAAERVAPHRWRVVLPARLHRARVLDVFIRWRNPRDGVGDADFWGGIRPARG